MKYNRFKYRWKLWEFSINWGCNFGCPYCWYGEKPEFREIEDEMFLKQLQLFLRHAARNKKGEPRFGISFFRTESSLSADKMRKYVPILYDHGCVKYATTTNGYAWTKEDLEFLRKWNFEVLFSFEGTRQRQDIMRPLYGGQSSYDRVVDNILYYRDLGGNLLVLTLLIPETYQTIKEGVEAILSLGVPLYINVAIMHITPWTDDELRDLSRRLRPIAEMVMDDPSIIPRLGPYPKIIRRLVKWRGYNIHDPGTCGAIKGSIATDIDGSIYTCHWGVGIDAFKIGHVDTGLDYEKMARIANGACATGLSMIPYMNSCRVINYYFTGDMHRIPEIYTKVYHAYWKGLLEPVWNKMLTDRLYREKVLTLLGIKTTKKVSKRIPKAKIMRIVEGVLSHEC